MNSDYIKVEQPHRLLTPGSVILISTGNGKRDNIFSVAWNMPLKKDPPLVAILSGKGHYSYPLMIETGDFGINIPDKSLSEAVIKCGTVSGHEIDDKFKAVGLTRIDGQKIKAPLVKEAAARLECRITQIHDMGRAALIIALILRAEVNPAYYRNDMWDFDSGFEMIHHLGGRSFAVSDKAIFTPK